MAADGIPNPFHACFSIGAVLIEIPVAVLQNTSAKVEIGKQVHAHSVKAVFVVFVVEGGRARRGVRIPAHAATVKEDQKSIFGSLIKIGICLLSIGSSTALQMLHSFRRIDQNLRILSVFWNIILLSYIIQKKLKKK